MQTAVAGSREPPGLGLKMYDYFPPTCSRMGVDLSGYSNPAKGCWRNDSGHWCQRHNTFLHILFLRTYRNELYVSVCPKRAVCMHKQNEHMYGAPVAMCMCICTYYADTPLLFLFLYTYALFYIYINTHVYIYVYTYICVYYLCMHMKMYARICMCVYAYLCMCACIPWLYIHDGILRTHVYMKFMEGQIYMYICGM